MSEVPLAQDVRQSSPEFHQLEKDLSRKAVDDCLMVLARTTSLAPNGDVAFGILSSTARTLFDITMEAQIERSQDKQKIRLGRPARMQVAFVQAILMTGLTTEEGIAALSLLEKEGIFDPEKMAERRPGWLGTP